MSASEQTIFISYSREDSHFAGRLATDLKAEGLTVWIDHADVKIGGSWPNAVEQGLQASSHVLVILSPSSVSSTNVTNEVTVASREAKNIIPLLYRECKPPLQLSSLQHVDFRVDYGPSFQILLRALGVPDPEAGKGLEKLPGKEVSRLSWLATGKDVYEAAKHMVLNCPNEANIWATDLFPDTKEQKREAFDKYFATVTDRMADGVVYRLVVASDKKGWWKRGLERRHRIIAERHPEVWGQMRARYVREAFPLEVLIIEPNVLLGFPSVADGSYLTRGIFIDNAKVAREFVQWYEDSLWSKATPWTDGPSAAQELGSEPHSTQDIDE